MDDVTFILLFLKF